MTSEPTGERENMNPAAGRFHRVLTFDCYGTLVDWEAGIAGAFERAAAGEGLALDRRKVLAAYAACEAQREAREYAPYRQVLADAASCAARRLGWQLSPERATFLAESLPSWRPFPDTNPSLQRLARSFALGLLSNVDEDLLAATRGHLPVEWDLIVTAEQVRSYKPAHAHWTEARRRLGERQASWIHVAQSYYHDVVPALELGLPVIWVNRRAQRLEPGQPRATREVRDLREVADLLLGGDVLVGVPAQRGQEKTDG